jgi:hypothetical protein
MSNNPADGDQFTPEEEERIRAHIKARGMTFEVFLPVNLADWLRAKIATGVYRDAREAAFVAFENLRDLDEHPKVGEQLLAAVLETSLNDPRPAVPAAEWIKELRARLQLSVQRNSGNPRPNSSNESPSMET